jgi:hypothetical protein
MFLIEFTTFARPFAIVVFLANANHSIPLLNSLHSSNDRVKDESVLSSFSVYRSLRSFISDAVDYRLITRFNLHCICQEDIGW